MHIKSVEFFKLLNLLVLIGLSFSERQTQAIAEFQVSLVARDYNSSTTLLFLFL